VEGDLQRRVGQNLRKLRKAKGMSQEAFADSLHINRTYIGGVERGERNLTLRSVERVATSLGVDPIELLTDLGSPPVEDTTGPEGPTSGGLAGS
jgi:transcriptional regulator with XRE-family HTH domain